MTDSHLHKLLAVLDEVEPAPPELVERVWTEVELVVTQERPVVGGRSGGAEVVSIEHLAGPTIRPLPKRRVAVWLAVAAVVGMVVLSIAALSGGPAVPDDRRTLDAPENTAAPVRSRRRARRSERRSAMRPRSTVLAGKELRPQ